MDLLERPYEDRWTEEMIDSLPGPIVEKWMSMIIHLKGSKLKAGL